MHAVEVVMRDDDHRKAQPLTCIAGITPDRSRFHVNASRNFDDLHGAISCRIIANKLSSFSYAQDLCNGVFAFKIGQKLTEHEARKDDLVSSQLQNDRIKKKKKKKKKKGSYSYGSTYG